MRGLFQSKTVFGLLLGILGVLLQSTDFIQLPDVVDKVVLVIGGLITAMGLRDSMLEQQASLAAKILDLKSKTFWGVIIQAVVLLTDDPDQFAIPEELKMTLRILGAIAITLGLRDAAQRSKK